MIVLGQAVCALFSTQMPYNGILTIGQFCLTYYYKMPVDTQRLFATELGIISFRGCCIKDKQVRNALRQNTCFAYIL